MSERPTIQDAGRSLWGPEWMGEMARTMNIGFRKVRRFAKGDAPVPPGVWNELADLLEAEIVRLGKMVVALRERGRE